jgi:hypothetical protein
VLVLLGWTAAASAQQVPPPAVVRQPFGQPLPPPPSPIPPPARQRADGDRRLGPGWAFRGLIDLADRIGLAPEIDEPVLGYGNEALWEKPRDDNIAAMQQSKVAAPAKPR